MRTMIVAWATHLPWPLGGPDPDPSNHYTYVLFVPPALVVGFALVGWLGPRIPAYAALATRRRLPVFLGAGAAVGILLCVALAAMQSSVDRHRKIGKVASSDQNTAASIPVGEPPNPFVSAFCAGALGRASAAAPAALADEKGMLRAVDCLIVQTPPAMLRTLVPERVTLLVDRLYPPASTSPPDVPSSVERSLLRTLLAYRDWPTLTRLHERRLPLAEKFGIAPGTSDPLWWTAAQYDGRPLGLDDMHALEALGVDLRQRNTFGQQFMMGFNRVHDLRTDALAHIVRLGVDRAGVLPPSLAVEMMYRRFGWQRDTGSAADLDALLATYPAPTQQELEAAASVNLLDPRTLGPASVDPRQRDAYLAYMADHGLPPEKRR
jgi:hypothetical protein